MGLNSSNILAAAIRYKGIIYTGDRHGNIIQYLVKIGVLRDINKDKITYEMQGFINNTGMFLSRGEARIIAIAEKRVKKNHGTLYSEDLW